jgi:hypothetical protein
MLFLENEEPVGPNSFVCHEPGRHRRAFWCDDPLATGRRRLVTGSGTFELGKSPGGRPGCAELPARPILWVLKHPPRQQ